MVKITSKTKRKFRGTCTKCNVKVECDLEDTFYTEDGDDDRRRTRCPLCQSKVRVEK